MSSFEIALTKTLVYEGLYANIPNDSGGETWRGIARNFHKDWPGWVIIDAAKALGVNPDTLKNDPTLHSLVLTFYHEKFGHPLYEQIKDQIVLNELVDFGINAGVETAVIALQGALKHIVVGPVIVDGKFGPRTLEITNGVDVERLLLRFHIHMAIHYAKCAIRDPRKEKFLDNWMTRALEV